MTVNLDPRQIHNLLTWLEFLVEKDKPLKTSLIKTDVKEVMAAISSQTGILLSDDELPVGVTTDQLAERLKALAARTAKRMEAIAAKEAEDAIQQLCNHVFSMRGLCSLCGITEPSPSL